MKDLNKEQYQTELDLFMDNYAVNFGVDNIQRLTMVVLLCGITQSIRKTAPETLVIDVINKIIKTETTATNEFLIKTSYQCEALLTGEQVPFPDFGYKELKAKVDKIKEINENVLPF